MSINQETYEENPRPDIRKLNFQYFIEFEYEGDHSCETSGCDEEGICCYTINNTYITEDIDLLKITDHIYDMMIGNTKNIAIRRDITIDSLLEEFDMKKYFIYRILVLHKLYNKGYWEVKYGGNYYGDYRIYGIFRII